MIRQSLLLAAGMFSCFAVAGRTQVEIPLNVYYESGSQRVGIDLMIGNSGVYTQFLLDTGSQPLIVNPGIDLGSAAQVPNQTSTVSYGANGSTSFDFDNYAGNVTLRDTQNNTYSSNVNFGSITSGGTAIGGSPGGILGAGPSVHKFSNSSGSGPSSFNLFSIIGQIAPGGSLLNGYTIRVDGNNSVLKLGVSADDWNSLPSSAKVVLQPGSSELFPTTGATTYDEDQIEGTLKIEGNDGQLPYTSSSSLNIKLDSGAPSAFFVADSTHEFDDFLNGGYLDDVNSEQTEGILVDNTEVSLGNVEGYSYLTGSGGGTTEVKVFAPGQTNTHHFNTGIEIFNQYEITFLLDGNGSDIMGGYVGFNPIPEPASGTLLGMGLFAWMMARRRRK